MIGMLNRLQLELFAFAIDPFGWLQRHDVGPRGHLDPGEACNALGVPGKGRPEVSETTPAEMHLHGEDGTTLAGAAPADPSCCVDLNHGFWETGIGPALLKACGCGAAFLLAVGAYQGVRAAMRGMVAALPGVLIPSVVRMIELVFDLSENILG